MELLLANRVIVVTGAGGGLGRAYALDLAKRGAAVVVNDVAKDKKTGEPYADRVVSEIKSAGYRAIANYDSALEGHKIIQQALSVFGRVDGIVNNAGILRDKSFHKMSDKDWDSVLKVHVYATRSVCKAAWPLFRKQKFGRVINISSVNGLYGAYGQANYSTAKSAMVGLSKTLAKEGRKYNIKVNVVAPGAGGDSKMTKTILPPPLYQAWKPEYVTPIVSLLVSEKCPCSGRVFEAGGGYFGEVKWQRSEGLFLPLDKAADPLDLLKNWNKVTDFSKAIYPEEDTGMTPQLRQIAEKLAAKSKL